MTDELVRVLKGFADAYPEDVFPPLTPAERKEVAHLMDRISASMGRHMAKYTSQAASLVERQEARLSRLRGALQMLYDDQMDYITINHLCGAENNHAMVAARKALEDEKHG